MTIHVFSGPTLTALEVRRVLPDAQVYPPVKLGDLLRLAPAPGDVVVIVDGLFHQVAPVRHKEILDLIADGVSVLGSSSMGALRAAELHHFGMIGVGEVFAMYRDGRVEADDEVAVVHTEHPGYRQLSEPLVNIRWALSAAGEAGILTTRQEDSLLARARSLPYPSRSWTALQRNLTDGEEELRGALAAVRDFLTAHPQHANRKREDALVALAAAKIAHANGHPPVPDWADRDDWRTTYLHHWRARFRGEHLDGHHVDDLSVLHYHQIYDPGFPARWRSHVLAIIAASSSDQHGTEADVPTRTDEDRALAVAASTGVTSTTLSLAQRAHWLTPDELGDLNRREQLVRVLVRSYQSYPGAGLVLCGDEPGLVTIDRETRRLVAEAREVNARVALLGGRRHIDDLKVDKLRDHLASTWAVIDPKSPELLAAARDRGFPSIADAVEAARDFFLSKVVPNSW